MTSSRYVAVDLGAESGRVIVGTLMDGNVALEEIHRFANPQRKVLGHVYWDVLYLFEEIKKGLAETVKRGFKGIVSIGIDTWGVDFGLVGSSNEVLGFPFSYRDARTDGMLEQLFERIPREELFAETGVQPMQINSLVQLFAVSLTNPGLLDACDRLLFMPDLLNLLLTGERYSEYTIASTSQLLNVQAGIWSEEIMHRLGLPMRILSPIIQPGTVVGKLLPDVALETGLSEETLVVAVGSHDTASAVAAVPAISSDSAFLSSGTWSLIGIETETPHVSPEADRKRFTNEGGVGGKILLLQNLMGMWLVQQCMRDWGTERESISYGELISLVSTATPFTSLIDPDAPAFLHPASMSDAIRQFCLHTGQTAPESKAAFIRGIFESLALKYRGVLEDINSMNGKPVGVLHIVGGGSRNHLLNQWTADACGVPVMAGPKEATALGNILMQAVTSGAVPSIEEARQLVADSFQPIPFEPVNPEPWTRYAVKNSFFH